MIKTLYIHHKGDNVGEIIYDSLEKTYDLAYDEDWIKNGFEISPSLSFSGSDNEQVKRFLENLLPEGDGLDELSQYLNVSQSEKFSILQEIGIDVSGALTFSTTKKFSHKTSFREIEDEELEQRIREKEFNPIHIWDDKPRLSLAGVQAKLPISIIDNKIGFGEGDISSTHLLKFNKPGENIVINEYLTMRLLKNLGFNIAHVDCAEIAGECVLVVKRFDRKEINSSLVEKIHVIDSVQALGLPVSFKYERNMGKNYPEIREGVSFSKLFSLSEHALSPALFKEQLIKWCIINLIIGNSDAHGKNISFFVSKDGLEITPFYDLINVSIYKQYKHEMAMGIDEAFEFDDIDVHSVQEFCEDNNVPIQILFEEFKKTSEGISNIIYNKDYEAFGGVSFVKNNEELFERYMANTVKRINRLTDVFNESRFHLPYEGQTEEEFFDESEIQISRVLHKSINSDDKKGSVSRYLESIRKRMILKIE